MNGTCRTMALVSVIAATWLGGACGAPSGPSGAGPKGPATPASDGAVAALCVDTINQYRATLGLAAYARWTEGEACADGQSLSDSASGTPHGAFGRCTETAQNECPGSDGTPTSAIGRCLEVMWAEGPGSDFARHGHYINMSSPLYTKVACGFFTTASGRMWSVQDFK